MVYVASIHTDLDCVGEAFIFMFLQHVL